MSLIKKITTITAAIVLGGLLYDISANPEEEKIEQRASKYKVMIYILPKKRQINYWT